MITTFRTLKRAPDVSERVQAVHTIPPPLDVASQTVRARFDRLGGRDAR